MYSSSKAALSDLLLKEDGAANTKAAHFHKLDGRNLFRAKHKIGICLFLGMLCPTSKSSVHVVVAFLRRKKKRYEMSRTQFHIFSHSSNAVKNRTNAF